MVTKFALKGMPCNCNACNVILCYVMNTTTQDSRKIKKKELQTE